MNAKDSAKELAAFGRLPTFSGSLALLASLRHGLRQLVLAFHRRREITALARLNQHMLADIGLNHTDVRDALSEPFWRDPTSVLEERVAARRARRIASG